MTYTKEELAKILEDHRKWARGEDGGQRADLQGADLQGADLQGADLQGADLRGAYLQGAYLRGADLRRADLRRADLRDADLRDADLRRADLQGADLRDADLRDADLRRADLRDAKNDPIKEDLFKILSVAKNEVAGLYDALMRGRVDGSTYSGECACLVGTVANIRKEDYQSLGIDLRPDANRPAERWFLAITKGQTPSSNPVAELTAEWIQEFAKANGISLPEYKIVSSAEYPAAFGLQEAK